MKSAQKNRQFSEFNAYLVFALLVVHYSPSHVMFFFIFSANIMKLHFHQACGWFFTFSFCFSLHLIQFPILAQMHLTASQMISTVSLSLSPSFCKCIYFVANCFRSLLFVVHFVFSNVCACYCYFIQFACLHYFYLCLACGKTCNENSWEMFVCECVVPSSGRPTTSKQARNQPNKNWFVIKNRNSNRIDRY